MQQPKADTLQKAPFNAIHRTFAFIGSVPLVENTGICVTVAHGGGWSRRCYVSRKMSSLERLCGLPYKLNAQLVKLRRSQYHSASDGRSDMGNWTDIVHKNGNTKKRGDISG